MTKRMLALAWVVLTGLAVIAGPYGESPLQAKDSYLEGSFEVARRERKEEGARGILGELERKTISVGGLERSYFVHVPKSSAGKALPVVFIFHGGNSSVTKTAQASRMHQLADQEGFIAVYPVGTGGRRDDGGTWNAGGDPPLGYAEKNNIDDVGFVRAILAELEREHTIDRRRIFATGISKGGMLAYWLACRMSDTFAAIAPVASSMTAGRCEPSGPVAVLHIHGDADNNVPLEGGQGKRSRADSDYPPVMQGLKFWAKEAQCDLSQRDDIEGQDKACWQFPGCTSGKPVALCLVPGQGHAWPGMSTEGLEGTMKKRDLAINTSFDASRQIWAFFKAHPK